MLQNGGLHLGDLPQRDREYNKNHKDRELSPEQEA